MPAKGPLQSVQVFGRKVSRGHGGLLHLLLAAGLGRAFGPFALGVSRPQLLAGAVRRDWAAGGPAGTVSPGSHVSRSVAAEARRVPGALRSWGDGFAPLGSGSGWPLTGVFGSGRRYRPGPLWPGLPLPASEGHVVSGEWEGKMGPVGWNAASRVIHDTSFL